MARDEKDKQIVTDFQVTFGTPEGKRVLDHLMNVSVIARRSNAVSLDGVKIDTSRLLFDEGQRCFMLHILEKVNYDPPNTFSRVRSYLKSLFLKGN